MKEIPVPECNGVRHNFQLSVQPSKPDPRQEQNFHFRENPFVSSYNETSQPDTASAISSELLESLHARHMKTQKMLLHADVEYVDAFHGEMGFGVHDKVRDQLAIAEAEGYDVTDDVTGGLKSKTTPKMLQHLVAKHLLHRWAAAIPDFSAKHVVMTPYSSLLTIESVFRSLHTINPGKTSLLVPDGHYKSLVRHVAASGLNIVPIRTSSDNNCRLEPKMLRTAISENREDLAGLLLTIPGNPLLTDYSADQLDALGAVLVEENVFTIVDAAFEHVVAPYKPLAAVTLSSGAKLYDRVATVTAISKSHHATGPEKIGVVVTGNAEWREAMGMELSHQFQRETSARAELVLKHTPAEWIVANAESMREAQIAANQTMEDIEATHSRKVFVEVGKNTEGPFKVMTVASDLLQRLEISDSAQLQEHMLISGLDCVPGIRMGFDCARGHAPVVRINVHAPRIGNIITSAYRPQLYAALRKTAGLLVNGPSYPELCKSWGLEPVSIPLPTKSPEPTYTMLGVIHEKAPELRVALTPSAVRSLVSDPKRKVRVMVESQAGVTAGFSDDDFIRAGARISGRADILANVNGLIAYKPCKALTRSELKSLRPDQCVIGFFGNYGRGIMANSDICCKSISLDDGSTMSVGVHSPLSAMSVMAGELALDHAAALSLINFTAHLTTNEKAHALVLGSGHASRAAASRALDRGMTVTVVCTSSIPDRYLASRVVEVLVPRDDEVSTQKIMTAVLKEKCPQLVVAAAAKGFSQAPKLLTEEHVKMLSDGDGVVIVDLAASAGGNTFGAKLGQVCRPHSSVIVANESNYPSKWPRTASSAFSSAMLRFLQERNVICSS